MPQGTIPRGPAFFDPELKGRWGAVRLAESTEVPIIPIGLWGTEQVWPRSVEAAEPDQRVGPARRSASASVSRWRSSDAASTPTPGRIMAAIADLLPPEAREPHEPTPEELARTYPGGIVPDDLDAEHEATRRPGTD